MAIKLFPNLERMTIEEHAKSNNYEDYIGVVLDKKSNTFKVVEGRYTDKKDMYRKMKARGLILRKAYEKKVWQWIEANADSVIISYLMLSTAFSKWRSNNVLHPYYQKLLNDIPELNREREKGNPNSRGGDFITTDDKKAPKRKDEAVELEEEKKKDEEEYFYKTMEGEHTVNLIGVTNEDKEILDGTGKEITTRKGYTKVPMNKELVKEIVYLLKDNDNYSEIVVELTDKDKNTILMRRYDKSKIHQLIEQYNENVLRLKDSEKLRKQHPEIKCNLKLIGIKHNEKPVVLYNTRPFNQFPKSDIRLDSHGTLYDPIITQTVFDVFNGEIEKKTGVPQEFEKIKVLIDGELKKTYTEGSATQELNRIVNNEVKYDLSNSSSINSQLKKIKDEIKGSTNEDQSKFLNSQLKRLEFQLQQASAEEGNDENNFKGEIGRIATLLGNDKQESRDKLKDNVWLNDFLLKLYQLGEEEKNSLDNLIYYDIKNDNNFRNSYYKSINKTNRDFNPLSINQLGDIYKKIKFGKPVAEDEKERKFLLYNLIWYVLEEGKRINIKNKVMLNKISNVDISNQMDNIAEEIQKIKIDGFNNKTQTGTRDSEVRIGELKRLRKELASLIDQAEKRDVPVRSDYYDLIDKPTPKIVHTPEQLLAADKITKKWQKNSIENQISGKLSQKDVKDLEKMEKNFYMRKEEEIQKLNKEKEEKIQELNKEKEEKIKEIEKEDTKELKNSIINSYSKEIERLKKEIEHYKNNPDKNIDALINRDENQIKNLLDEINKIDEEQLKKDKKKSVENTYDILIATAEKQYNEMIKSCSLNSFNKSDHAQHIVDKRNEKEIQKEFDSIKNKLEKNGSLNDEEINDDLLKLAIRRTEEENGKEYFKKHPSEFINLLSKQYMDVKNDKKYLHSIEKELEKQYLIKGEEITDNLLEKAIANVYGKKGMELYSLSQDNVKKFPYPAYGGKEYFKNENKNKKKHLEFLNLLAQELKNLKTGKTESVEVTQYDNDGAYQLYNSIPYQGKGFEYSAGPIKMTGQIMEDTTKTELNPKLFENDVLIPKVRDALYKIATVFKDYLDLPFEIKDMYLTGSNANYNYTDDSDIDLHLVYDFEQAGVNAELLSKYLVAAKKDFNDKYDIKVKGMPVELGCENINEPLVSTGVYSLGANTWVIKPNNSGIEIPDVDMNVFNDLSSQINTTINSNNTNAVKSLWKSIRELRKNSLANEGEFGIGNLLFKKLRNGNYLEKLRNKMYDVQSKDLSLESSENLDEAELNDKRDYSEYLKDIKNETEAKDTQDLLYNRSLIDYLDGYKNRSEKDESKEENGVLKEVSYVPKSTLNNMLNNEYDGIPADISKWLLITPDEESICKLKYDRKNQVIYKYLVERKEVNPGVFNYIVDPETEEKISYEELANILWINKDLKRYQSNPFFQRLRNEKNFTNDPVSAMNNVLSDQISKIQNFKKDQENRYNVWYNKGKKIYDKFLPKDKALRQSVLNNLFKHNIDPNEENFDIKRFKNTLKDIQKLCEKTNNERSMIKVSGKDHNEILNMFKAIFNTLYPNEEYDHFIEQFFARPMYEISTVFNKNTGLPEKIERWWIIDAVTDIRDCIENGKVDFSKINDIMFKLIDSNPENKNIETTELNQSRTKYVTFPELDRLMASSKRNSTERDDHKDAVNVIKADRNFRTSIDKPFDRRELEGWEIEEYLQNAENLYDKLKNYVIELNKKIKTLDATKDKDVIKEYKRERNKMLVTMLISRYGSEGEKLKLGSGQQVSKYFDGTYRIKEPINGHTPEEIQNMGSRPVDYMKKVEFGV